MSPEIRMYFPLTPAQVVRLHAEGRIDAGLVGFAVDDSIRGSEPDGNTELWEFRALQRAATHAHSADGPVVIAAADVSATGHAPALSHGPGGAPACSATLAQPLTLVEVSCLHLGDDALGDHTSDDDTHGDHTLDHAPNDVPRQHIDLSWFDISEMAQVVCHLSSPQ